MKDLQKRVIQWAIACFGMEHVYDTKVRALRLLEESIEFAQAVGVPYDQAANLTAFVYSRPAGDPDQELGGIGVTFLAACESRFKDATAITRKEVERVESKPREHFTQRNQSKIAAGFK